MHSQLLTSHVEYERIDAMLGSITRGHRTQWERKKYSNKKGENDTQSEAHSYFSPVPLNGVSMRVYL
jgi:hypothetical protein